LTNPAKSVTKRPKSSFSGGAADAEIDRTPTPPLYVFAWSAFRMTVRGGTPDSRSLLGRGESRFPPRVLRSRSCDQISLVLLITDYKRLMRVSIKRHSGRF
jgi:hypothetical protein